MSSPQDGSDRNFSTSVPTGCANAVHETWDKCVRLSRQGEVLKDSVLAAGTQEVGNEIAKNPIGTALNAGVSLGLGAGFAFLQLRYKMIHKAVAAIAGLAGIKAGYDGCLRLSHNEDFKKAMDGAWEAGDRATIEQSKALATKALAPEIVQFEVATLAGGAGYGGFGFAALKNRTFAQPWSRLMERAADCLQRNKASVALEPISEIVSPVQGSIDSFAGTVTSKPGKRLLACDEQGIPLAEATISEQEIITEYVRDLQTLAGKASPRLRLAIRKQDGSLELDCDTWYAQPKKPHEASSDRDLLEEVIPKLNSEKSLKYGTKVKEAFFGYNPSNGDVLLNSEFLEANYVCPDWRLALIDQSEISFYDRSHNVMRPVLRPNDMERIVLECVRHHIGKTLPEISFMAQRTIGPASGRTVGPIMLEILTSKEPTPDLRLKLDVIMEKVYKQLRIRPDYRFAEHECETWPVDYDSVPLSLEHISKTSYAD